MIKLKITTGSNFNQGSIMLCEAENGRRYIRFGFDMIDLGSLYTSLDNNAETRKFFRDVVKQLEADAKRNPAHAEFRKVPK